MNVLPRLDGLTAVLLAAAVAVPIPPAAPIPARHQLYVSQAGSDQNDGSIRLPFRNVLKASEHAKPGTVVNVASGVYNGGFETRASGTADAPIAYVSDVPGGAKIVGAAAVNEEAAGWSNRGDHVHISGFEIDGRDPPASKWQIGFFNGGSHVTFSGNVVHDVLRNSAAYQAAESTGNGGAGIMMDRYYGGSDGTADGNLVYNIGPDKQISNHVQGIYVTEPGFTCNNVVYNVAGVGVHLWHGAERISILNNTIDNAREGGISVGSGDGGSSPTTGDYVTVANNIVVNSPKGIYEWGITGVHNSYVGNVLSRNSAVIGLRNGLKATGTVITDPNFVDAAAHDYRLRQGSPATGRGSLKEWTVARGR